MKAQINIAVAGNPNAGKTTLFNTLTGSNQRVGNYPGVTVEKKEGDCRVGETTLHFVDLPGTYSLTAYSQDELVARSFIVEERPDVILNVIDASNLERNLYLSLQLAEMGVPMVVALNMHDIARQRNIHIDIAKLSSYLGVPVVATIGHKKEGKGELIQTLLDVASGKKKCEIKAVHYGPDIEKALKVLGCCVENDEKIKGQRNPRWLAIKLLEQDEKTRERILKEAAGPTAILDLAEKNATLILSQEGEDASLLIAEHRYGHAAGIVQDCVNQRGDRQTLSDAIDMLVCNRILGFVFVALVVYATFTLTFALADGWAYIPWEGGWTTPVGVFGWFFEEWLPGLFGGMADGPFKSLVLDGCIAGVGGVMGFVPLIFFMFLLLALIEDSGYIARIAFVLDRVLRVFGLQGKSLMSMIISGGIAGGCAVPGVMATRTLREEKDRLTTMLVVPFMNCGAKMPVFAMLIGAFFAAHQGLMMWLLAGMSWSIALIAAFVLRKTVIKGEQTPFVMELPPYHMPRPMTIFRSALERSWMYMRKAGTVILGVSILIWAMMYFPRMDTSTYDARIEAAETRMKAAVEKGADEEKANAAFEAEATEIQVECDSAQLRQSAAGRMGRALESISQVAGFDWRTNIALVGGFAAKEVVVSTLSTAYSMETSNDEVAEQPITELLKTHPDWNPLKAFALLVFVMVYAPCMVTVAVIWRESGSWKWAAFSVVYTTTLAFILATTIYQVGKALGLGA